MSWTPIEQGAATVLPPYGKNVLLSTRAKHRLQDSEVTIGSRSHTDARGEHWKLRDGEYLAPSQTVDAWQELPAAFDRFTS